MTIDATTVDPELEPPCPGSGSGFHCSTCERHGHCCYCIDIDPDDD